MTECYTNGCQVINMLLQISQQWLYMSISYKVPAVGGKYTHVKKTSNSENAERKQPTRNFRCWSMGLCGPAMRQLDVVKGHMYLTSGSTDCNTIYIIMIQS